jgi:HSP20 family protein
MVASVPKRKPYPFDSIWDFDDMDEMMERFRMIDRFMNEALEQLGEREGSIFCGFSISVGTDGKPTVNEFGNVIPGLKGPELTEEIEPLVDVVDGKDSVTVYAELPGVEKKEIGLSAAESGLTISVLSDKRRYYKAVDLPYKINPDTAKVTYKNGVLEVCLEKVMKGRGRSSRWSNSRRN